MALFDLAQMGKGMMKKEKALDEKSSCGNVSLDQSVKSENIGVLCMDDASTISDFDSVCSDPCSHERIQTNRTNSSCSVEPDENPEIEKGSFGERIKNSLTSFSIRSKDDSGAVSGKKKLMASDPALVYADVDTETSQYYIVKAQKRGYGPAYQILQSMTRSDRHIIMDKIFIKRRALDVCSDEQDSFDILFKKIYGLRSRTNTALRSIRVLQQSTWMLSLQRATIALNISAKMIFYQGDWRIPTRFVTGMSSKQGMVAAREDFEKGDFTKLDEIEHKFFIALSKNFAKRLGPELARDIRNHVVISLRNKGSAYAELFQETTEFELEEAAEIEASVKKADKKLKKAEAKFAKTNSSPALAEDFVDQKQTLDDDMSSQADDIDHFDALGIINNMEAARPGFGRHAILLIQILAMQAKYSRSDEEFSYTDLKDFLKKMGCVGAKDAAFGLTVGITLSTFVNPFLGFPLMAMSLINLTLGSTEARMIEPICMLQLHSLLLLANGTNVYNN